jgi:BMFP domain-containing protein YqiC
MEGQEISAINALFTSGLLDQRSALDLLKRGELLGDDFDVEEAMEAAEQEELASLEQEISKVEAQAQLTAAAAPIPPAGAASEPKPPKAK